MTVAASRSAAVLARIDAELASLDVADAAFANAFHIADANLRHFFPSLDATQAHALIRDLLHHQRMSTLDQDDFDLLREAHVESECGDLPWRAGAPRIFCTYHFGSYKFLFQALAARGVDCLLFVSGRTLERQADDFLAASVRAREACGWRGTLDILDAEKKHSALQGLRALKRGTPLVLYVDGNTGTGSGDDHLLPVTFFGKTLSVRPGIAYLSHAAAAPILPVTCRRRADASLHLRFHAAIEPGPAAREAYLADAMQRVYDVLAAALADDLAQWEGWLYVHRHLAKAALDAIDADTAISAADAEARVRGSDRYALLRFPGLRILLDKARFACTLVDDRGGGQASRS